MVINLPRDDLGVLRPKDANARRAVAPVSSLAATARIGAQATPSSSTPASAPEERRRGERRQDRQRRGHLRQAAVLLDTRSHYERRTHERRHAASDQGQRHLPRGIDIHI
jgi:hypothetical protein